VQIGIELIQGVELAVFGDRLLPPRRRLDGLDLGVSPGQGVGRSLVQPPTDGISQRLVEANLRPLDATGKDVFARNRRKRDGGQQSANRENENQTAQTPHRPTPLFCQAASGTAPLLRKPATRS